jgi:hypothetical protein
LRAGLVKLVVLLPMLVTGVAEARPDARLRAFLLTIGPGPAVYEKFGHNIIVVVDPEDGSETGYNWGVFDPSKPGFYWRYAMGRMLYSMESAPAGDFVAWYREQGRWIDLRELNLSPEQAQKLRRLCRENDQPGRREYHYDYFRDNCSTRVRDMIDASAGGQLRRSLQGQAAGRTFRDHVWSATQNSWAWFLPLLGVLGPSVDRPIDAWEESFLPDRLVHWAQNATVQWEDGSVHPLLGPSRSLGTEPVVAAELPRARAGWTTAVGFLVGGIILLLHNRRATPARRILHGLSVGMWGVVAGLAGSVMAFLWLWTDHHDCWRNWNLMQLSPVSLLAGIGALATCLRTGPGFRWVALLNGLPLLLAVVGVLLEWIPGWGQVNGPVVAMVLPIHAAVAYTMWHRCWDPPRRDRPGAVAEKG